MFRIVPAKDQQAQEVSEFYLCPGTYESHQVPVACIRPQLLASVRSETIKRIPGDLHFSYQIYYEGFWKLTRNARSCNEQALSVVLL